MEGDLHNFGTRLNEFVSGNLPAEAETLISSINKAFTENELPEFTIDTYLLNIFKKSDGLLVFLNKILHNSDYKKVKLKSFELLYTLVNNCPNKMKNHLIDIIRSCSPVVRSSVTAIEKEKSLELLTLIIEQGKLYEDNQNDVDTELSELYKNTLYKCLHLRFDKSSTVHEELLRTVGALAKKYPAVIENPSELKTTLINQLGGELRKSSKSFPVIAGTVAALSAFLENFPFSSDDIVTADVIYKSIKFLADPGEATRKVAFRESLSLVAKHMTLLSQTLYSEAKWWHCTLLKWFRLGVEDKKAAFKTIEAFYLEMSKMLAVKSGNKDQELFQYFMNYFVESITKPLEDNYELQAAIRGLGVLAESFKTHITPRDINKIFVTISQLMEHIYVLNSKPSSDQIIYLPDYVRTLSFIIKNVPHLNNNHVSCLQRVTAVMIRILPQLSPTQHYLVTDAFVLTLFQLLQCKNKVLDKFLEDVVYQSVLWTCSHEIALNAEFYKDEDLEITTYKNYLSFWNGVLTIGSSIKYEKYEINVKSRKLIVRKFFDELIRTLFGIIQKLNLKIQFKDNALPVTDLESTYEAEQTNDFAVFINAVDFYQDILDNIDPDIFKAWICVFTNRIIVKSMKHPLVSGFYKLLTSCLKVCDGMNYFDKSRCLAREEINICYQSVCRFLSEVLWKMKQYKGDLQLACMYLILAAPVCTVKHLLSSAAPAFVAIFDVGRSYLKLSSLAIDTLEKWTKYLPQAEIEPFLKEILPSLDSYLQSKSLGGNFVSNSTVKFRKTKQMVSKRKVLIETEPELLDLQMKILTFLGQLNSDLCLSFVSSGSNIEPVVWNKTPHLKVKLSYPDTKLDLYLDKLVPRVVAIAQFSSDRKTRVSACELLHSIIMVMLGTSHSMNSSKDLDCLMKAVAKPILKLGCDVDDVIQQLYCPLAKQMMHYYSHPRQIGYSHTQIIIETLNDAISNCTDSALRDFAGSCIKEFVSWTIKQTDPEDLLRNPINIKLWVRTIHFFSIHPDPFKRLGAALIFNNIYVILREETHMFNMFWLEILHSLVFNLSLAQVHNSDDNNSVEQVNKALDHVQRGFIEKYQLFNKADNVRKTPLNFEGNELKDVVLWLLKKAGCLNGYCRRKCMSMFCKLAPLVTNCNNSIQKFKDLYINSDQDWIAETFEEELLQNPTLNNLQTTDSTNGLFKWMQSMLCTLDGYIFVMVNELLPPNYTSSKTTFINSLQFFLQCMQTQNIREVLNLIPASINGVVYSVTEKETFNSLKVNIVIKILEFINVAFEQNGNLTYVTSTPDTLWGIDLCKLICHCIFDPQALGFDITNTEGLDFLPTILNKIIEKCPQHCLNIFVHSLSMYVIKNYSTEIELNSTSIKQREILKGMLLLRNTSFEDKLNLHQYYVGTVNVLLCGLNENRNEEKIVIKLNANSRCYWALKLELALKNKEEFSKTIDFILDQTDVLLEEQNKIVKYGEYFFDVFKDVIIKRILADYSFFVARVFKVGPTHKALEYVLEVLQYVHQNKKTIESGILNEVVLTSIVKWNHMHTYFDSSAIQKLSGITFLNNLSSASKTSFHSLIQEKPEIVKWIHNLLCFEDPEWTLENSLDFKLYTLDVLPLATGAYDINEVQLREALESLKSKYLDPPHNLQIILSSLFKKLLHTLAISKSKAVLSCVIDIYITTSYAEEDVDLENPLKLFIQLPTVDQQLTSLQYINEMCHANRFAPMQRYIIVKDVLSNLLKFCHYDAFEQFYISIIAPLASLLDTGKECREFNINQVVNKTIAFILIELLFLRIKTEKFENHTCPITQALLSGRQTNSNLTKIFTGHALGACKEKFTMKNQEERDCFRLYECHSYNALVSIITNTKKEIAFYNWLFIREENGQDILWKNIVDVHKRYVFEVDFDKIPSTRKMLINIRNNLLTTRKKTDPSTRTVQYIESQHLFKSTLSEDITKFDLSNVILRSQLEENETGDSETTHKIEVTLESIHINKHECMPTICGLIQYMVDNGVSPLPIDQEDVALPKWMKGLQNVMMQETTSNNVKLFLAKVVHNKQDVFKPYAKWFFEPLIKVIIDGCAGDSINYFVSDLVVLLTSWSDVAIPSEKPDLASKLLEYLMKNISSERRDIFKYHLELVKLVLEAWKNCLIIPHELIFEKLQLELTSHKLDVGIHLAAVVLANNIIPWQPSEVKKFLMTLTKTMKSNNRPVYQHCAEVLGMSLKYMSADPNYLVHLESFKGYLTKNLINFIDDDDKFAYCLHGLVLHYPLFADNYLPRIVSKLGRVPGNFKSMYLKILLARVDVLQSINELSSINYKDLLVNENLEVQVLTLEIIAKSVCYLKDNEFVNLLDSITKFHNNSFTICRSLMYDIVITSYNLHCSEQNLLSKQITEIAKDTLLQGLVDKDLIIQQKVFTFWVSNNLPNDIYNRFLFLLSNMYKANIEEHYVGYSTSLLLDMINSTEEFNEKLFEHPLYECTFQDYALVGNWRRQHSSIAPLFAETFRSQESTAAPMNFNVLRASMSTLEFQPTQAPTYLSNSSSLLFNFNASKAEDQVFKNPNDVLPKSYHVRGRRFLKDKSKISRHFAHLEVKKSLKAEVERKEKVKQKERNIVVCRKYRIGDYPDIEITLASIITPLQNLAKSDTTLARCLYISLFSSFFDKIKKDDKHKDFIQSVYSSICNILNRSTQYTANTMGTFLEIALKYKNDLQFPPNMITNICQSSKLLSIGTLILEENLISGEISDATPAKRIKGIENEPNVKWLKLAELYKEMEEKDAVTAIFLEKINCSENAMNAIKAELSGQWRNAHEFYAKAIEEDPSCEKKDFYYESYFKCFAALAEWNLVSVTIENTITTNSQDTVWQNLWDDDWNQQKLLPWYITAELHNIMLGGDGKLFTCINKCLNDVEKIEYLKHNFSEELAMLWLLQSDEEMANYYLRNGITNFLESWSQISPLFVKLRANKILHLQSMIHINIFLSTIGKAFTQNGMLKHVLKLWEETFCTPLNSLTLSETRMLYHDQFISSIRKKLQHSSITEDLDAINQQLNDLKFKLHMNLIENALYQGNYQVARKYIKRSPKPDPNNAVEKLQWTLACSEILFIRADGLENKAEKASSLIDSWSKAVDVLPKGPTSQDSMMCYFIRANEHVYNLTQELHKVINLKTLLPDQKRLELKKLMGGKEEPVWRVGMQVLQDAVENCENKVRLMMDKENLKVNEHLANAYVKLAYCAQNKGEQFDREFIVWILRAMRFGSGEGNQLFPCLLSKDIGVKFKDDFLKESADVPKWMFIKWLPQILANLDTSRVFVISDILLHLAKMYPQAVMYSYRLSKEKYTFNSSDIETHGRKTIEQLDQLLLNDDCIETFLKSMSNISSPFNILIYYVKKLRSSKSKQEYDEILQKSLHAVYSDKGNYKRSDSLQGIIFKKIEKYESVLKTTKGKHGTKDFNTKLDNLWNELKNSKFKSSRLVEYSPWLMNFQSTKLHGTLEIPGQYTGETLPLPQYHTKIMGFSPNVLPMKSLRAPIRVTILGNNAKEYHYLVKFGEDLRQDQRIEQMFDLMNKILSHDRNCHERQMSIYTYQVIPFNTSLGIIEWINNTQELKDIVENNISTEYERKQYSDASNLYMSWLKRASLNSKDCMYGSALSVYSKDKVLSKFTELINSVDLDILRKAFWNLSVNAESFFALRQKCIVSYAVMCISQWILGIGDRHLSNTLICLNSGQAVGIDFGHAFGTATQILPIPELIPFRLTPHIVHFLKPLGEQGILQETMIHCVRAFRRNRDVLLATSDVFIKEPSLDWLEFAQRFEITNNRSSKKEWYPYLKLSHVRRKLEGANPSTIVVEELSAGHSCSKFLNAYIKLVKGTPNHNFRATKGENLSEENQVKCLLDHSTDYNLLGRMYAGWQAWI